MNSNTKPSVAIFNYYWLVLVIKHNTNSWILTFCHWGNRGSKFNMFITYKLILYLVSSGELKPFKYWKHTRKLVSAITMEKGAWDKGERNKEQEFSAAISLVLPEVKIAISSHSNHTTVFGQLMAFIPTAPPRTSLKRRGKEGRNRKRSGKSGQILSLGVIWFLKELWNHIPGSSSRLSQSSHTLASHSTPCRSRMWSSVSKDAEVGHLQTQYVSRVSGMHLGKCWKGKTEISYILSILSPDVGFVFVFLFVLRHLPL